jgi:hypothetical protein
MRLLCPPAPVVSALYSCCFLPESVGVGSSGALMGMLSSWVVWIIFRWYVRANFTNVGSAYYYDREKRCE